MKFNPLIHLGPISVLLFLIALITGFYLFLFYKIDPMAAYHSTEMLSRQWVGGVMRSVHRYSSDMLVVTVLLHLAHGFVIGKPKRWVSWLSGLFGFGIIIIIGITGFVLVWDQKAKLIGLLSAKLIAAIPFFSPTFAGMFLISDLRDLGGIFRVAFALHFFLSLFFLAILYIHVFKSTKPRFLPPNNFIWMFTLVLIGLSLIFPVSSDAPAQATVLPVEATWDWYYFWPFYLMAFLSDHLTLVIVAFFPVFLLMLYYLRLKEHSRLSYYFKRAIKHPVTGYVALALFFVVPIFSNSNYQFYAGIQDKKVLILNIKYVSSPVVESERTTTGLDHMQSQLPIVERRTAVKIEVFSAETGNLLFSDIAEPAGIRSDAGIGYYHEFISQHDVTIKMREIDFPENVYSLENIRIPKGDAAVVTFTGGGLRVVEM